MSETDDHRGKVMRRRVLLGGAAGGAALMLLGDRALGQSTASAPGTVEEFVAWQESVFAAAERRGSLGQAERDLIRTMRAINASALQAQATTTTSTPTSSTATTAVPVTTTATTAPPPAAAPPGVNRVLNGGEHFPNGFTVPAGEVWAFASGAQVTSAGNVVVQGTLRMHEPDPQRRQRLTFVDVNPAGFAGGDTHTPIAGDVGLWVVDNGRLDLVGASKTSWTRLRGGANAGARSIDVENAGGWSVGDEVVVTSTAPRSQSNSHRAFDRRVVTGVSGNVVTLDQALTHAHPVVDGRFRAEVLNLTRTVVIEGTQGRQAHIVSLHQGMHATAQSPWTMKFVELRLLGPSKRDLAGREAGVAGRYPLHLHHAANRLDGTVVEGVAAHDCRNHVFVAHSSNGITFKDCVSHDSMESVYWWDPGQLSERVVYERCVAHHAVAPGVGEERFKTTGFFAAHTRTDEASKMIGCVAAAIEGIDSSGFFWDNASMGSWEFKGCTAHHVTGHGVRVWQNSSDINRLVDSAFYRCGGGVFHGAYSNRYQYRNVEFHDCGTGIDLSALSRQGDAGTRQLWHDVKVTACPTPMVLRDAPVNSEVVTDLRRCTIGSVRVEATHAEKHHWDFTDCNLPPSAFNVVSRKGDFRIRTQDGGRAWQLGPSGNWTSIPAF